MITENTLLNKINDPNVIIKKYPNNTCIFHEGDNCQNLAIIVEGALKISTTTAQGKEVIYRNLKKNDVFGNNLLFSSEPYYRGEVITLSSCKIAYISKKQLIDLLQKNKDFLESYLQLQADFSKALNKRIKLLSFDNAKERFLFFMQSHNNFYTYKSIKNLSLELNLERETLSRLLNKMIKNKELKRKDKTLYL